MAAVLWSAKYRSAWKTQAPSAWASRIARASSPARGCWAASTAARTTSTHTSKRRCRRSSVVASVGGEFRGHWSAVAARSLTRVSGASDPVRRPFPQAPAGGGAYAVGMRIHARRAILLALGWLPAAAAAQQVFKCVAGDEVAYQSTPCAAGQATEKAWEHGTYAPPDESYLQRIRQMEAASRQRDTQRRNASGPARSNSSRRGAGAAARGKSSIGRCDAAKAQRDRELYRLGPWRKIEDLRRRDPAVAEACKP